MHKISRSILLISSSILLSVQAADIRQGLVSYWPLDTLSDDLTSTPDLAGQNALQIINLDTSALVDGHQGKALLFDGATQYAFFTTPPDTDTGLPVSHKPQFSVLYWVKGLGNGQADRRIFSESSSTLNDPLFNIGTHNQGTNNAVDLYVRDNGVRISHAISTNQPLDDQWHQIAWVDDNGAAKLYIDGQLDSTFNYAHGTTPIDTTSLAAIVRAAVGNYFAGALDEVSVWERALTQAEVQSIMTSGIQTPVPPFPPQIIVQPQSSTNVEGENVTFSVAAIGTHPLNFQWFKGTGALPGATGSSLTLSNLVASDAESYSVTINNPVTAVTSVAAQLTVNPPPPPNLTNGLIAYWPLDVVQGTKTPDVINGYDMLLNNLTEADLVDGKVGKAFSFSNTRKTLLSRVHSPTDALPANKHESFTITMWTMVEGSGQNDLRVFSEANTGSSDPLFNIGTDNVASGSEVLDLFMRQSGWTTVDHVRTTATPFDGAWHHIAFVQKAGQRSIYIDGALDPLQIPAKPAGTWNVNDTTIGGILRASPSHWITGLIDDVAIWDRSLSPDEIAKVVADGIPVAPSNQLPLQVQSFTADFGTVAKGDTVTLRWEVNKDATVSISPGVGNVTANTVAGSGSISVPVNQTTSFVITLTRGAETVSATNQVQVLDNVAAGWHLLDNFQSYALGRITNKGAWKNPDGEVDVMAIGANQVLQFAGGDDLAALALNSLTLPESKSATLFFRFFAKTNDTTLISVNVGVTEKALRFVTDFAGDLGPYVHFDRLDGDSNVSIQAAPASVLIMFLEIL